MKGMTLRIAERIVQIWVQIRSLTRGKSYVILSMKFFLFESFNEQITWEYVLLSLRGVGFTSIHFQVTVDRLLEMFLAPAM